MRKLIQTFGSLNLRKRYKTTSFGSLARMIVGQQLSSKAASTIFVRFEKIIPTQDIHDCHSVVKIETQHLRSAGLSSAKAKFIRELALAACDGRLPHLATLRKMPETTIREILLQFNGIGFWTIEMFEIFILGKPDVLSLHDAGLRRGFELAYETDAEGKQGLKKYAAIWSPFCSTASLYLWKAADNPERLRKS